MRRVLLIDDSKTFIRILERIVKTELEVVGFAHNGLDGFQQYKNLSPDIVLLDITMPDCNGKECLQKIIEHNPKAKVIMVSSLGDEATVSECLRLGAKGFVPKEIITTTDKPSDHPLLKTIERVAAA